MTKKEYISVIESSNIDNIKNEAICKKYNFELSELMGKIISVADEVVFFDDGYRAMAYKEILNANDEYNVDFVGLGIIPIIDCYDNDYIVYCIGENKWAKFNLYENVLFKKRDSLEALMQ